MFFDFPVLYFIREHLSNSFFDFLMPLFSFITEGGVVWFAVALVFIFVPQIKKKYRACGIMMIIAMAAAFLCSEIVLKNIVCRVRPCYIDTTINMLVDRPTGYSFPSSHASSSFASATIIFLNNKKIGGFALILALLIAFSRLYLFVHFPTDVFAGMVIGILFAIFTYYIYVKKYKPGFITV